MDQWAWNEFGGANLHDRRMRKSLAEIATKLKDAPHTGWCNALGHDSRQAAAKMLHDDRTTQDKLMAAHKQQTLGRIEEMCAGRRVLIAQDTTVLNFTGLRSREGFGPIDHTKARGMFGHSALALTEHGVPLGIMDLTLYAREEGEGVKSGDAKARPIKEKESYRWIETANAVEKMLPAHQKALIIGDREADIYEYLSQERRAGVGLLVRAKHPRSVCVAVAEGTLGRSMSLFQAAAEAPEVARKMVYMYRRPDTPDIEIEVSIHLCAVKIQPPKRLCKDSDPIDAWVIRVTEVDPSNTEKPVEWVLITTEPVTAADEACEMVDFYAKRWRIERLHYTLKSGACECEKLQLGTGRAIKLAIAIYYIVAWQILSVMYLSREEPDAAVSRVLSESETEALQVWFDLPKPIETVGEAILLIARMGGFEPYRGGPRPGVKRLWLGMDKLAVAVEALERLARRQNTGKRLRIRDTC